MATFTFSDSNLIDAMNSVDENRGATISVSDMYGDKVANASIHNRAMHDANFAFLSTTLAKLYNYLTEPLTNTTYAEDIPIDVGGGFVDYVSYYTVDWAGIMDEFRNVTGNNANFIPRVNAGLNKKSVNVYTFEVAYDLRFVELEKMTKLTLQKSIQDIYQDEILAGWDLFVQKIAYIGAEGRTGLFNSENVYTATIDNTGTTGRGFEGLKDKAIISWFNGILQYALTESNLNWALVPDKICVPSYVAADLVSRHSELLTNTLYEFLTEHNIAYLQSGKAHKIQIVTRPYLDDLGTTGCGRIVAYRQEKRFVRMDMPYPMQHFQTMPNMERMSYTSLFVGQISEVQLPYSTGPEDFGPVMYWDFTTKAE